MKTNRILSIDIFRGLTIFLMVFVNDIAVVSDIPIWLKHAPMDVNGMTIPDVVFPAFLFIVGMAIPIAVDNRLSQGKGLFDFWMHVLSRTLGLIVLGVYMVNSGEMNVDATWIPKRIWVISLYIAAILIWNRYPSLLVKSNSKLIKGLRIIGVIILAALYFVFRKGPFDELSMMTPSWWGILGLIGWAYLISIMIYMFSSRNLILLLIGMILLSALQMILWMDLAEEYSLLSPLIKQRGHITHSLIVLSGTICTLLFIKNKGSQTSVVKIRNMVLIGILFSVLGLFTQPFGGISKIMATLSWAMFSIAICFSLYAIVYWIVDVKGYVQWANILKPAGKNPLLTYILPALIYAIVGYSFIPEVLTSGLGGIVKAVLFTLIILWVSDLLTKKGIRLHL